MIFIQQLRLLITLGSRHKQWSMTRLVIYSYNTYHVFPTDPDCQRVVKNTHYTDLTGERVKSR